MSTGRLAVEARRLHPVCVQSKRNRRPSNHAGNFVGDGLAAS